MTALLAALLTAHMAADYPLQTDWMAENKHGEKDALVVHSVVHGVVAALLAVGFGVHPATASLAGFSIAFLHGIVDSFALPIRWDQTAHLSTVVVLWVVLA